MPPQAASASPVSDFAAALTLIALASFVKVSELECRIAAKHIAIAFRTGQAAWKACLLLQVAWLLAHSHLHGFFEPRKPAEL